MQIMTHLFVMRVTRERENKADGDKKVLKSHALSVLDLIASSCPPLPLTFMQS